MILADRDILIRLAQNNLVITPLHDPVQPASVDLRLGNTYLRPRRGIVKPTEYRPDPEEREAFNFYSLSPSEFLNVSTLEWVEIPEDLVGIVTGKSSLARLGLQVEAAGFVDPGWKGQLTLELVNLGPSTIVLQPGMLICQIHFDELSRTPQHTYGDPALNSHYQNSEGPVAARFTPPQPTAEVEPES